MKDQRLQIAMLVGEINTLAYMVNEFTDYCVFVRNHGHIKNIEIEVCISKKQYNETAARADSSYDAARYPEERITKKLSRMKYQLKKILRDKKIDYSKLDYEIEEVRHYKLV